MIYNITFSPGDLIFIKWVPFEFPSHILYPGDHYHRLPIPSLPLLLSSRQVSNDLWCTIKVAWAYVLKCCYINYKRGTLKSKGACSLSPLVPLSMKVNSCCNVCLKYSWVGTFIYHIKNAAPLFRQLLKNATLQWMPPSNECCVKNSHHEWGLWWRQWYWHSQIFYILWAHSFSTVKHFSHNLCYTYLGE